MERNDIIKAMECCIKEQCENCCNLGNWHEQWNCMTDIMKKALSLIKELAEDNERLKKDEIAYDTPSGKQTMPNLLSLAEEIMRFRNAGRHTIVEVEDFIRAYNNSRTEIKEQKRLIPVDDLLAYCHKCADTVQGLADQILANIGKGESEISALGGCAYFLQEVRLYRFDIPNIIKYFIKESENANKED